MSQENVELIVAGFRRFEAGDDRWVEFIHPEVEWDLSAYPLADLPTRGRGREAYLETFATYFSGWLDYKARDQGNDRRRRRGDRRHS